jgi:hypothetical protein
MLLGEGGLGVSGSPSPHYKLVEDTCVACHMGDERNHTYLSAVARCQACHEGAENFDVNGVQTEVKAMVDELTAIFMEKGMLRLEDPGPYVEIGSETCGKYYLTQQECDVEPAYLWIASTTTPLVVPEAVANAMWNYKFVVYDKSMGVHNAAFTKALLEAALETMKAYNP